MRIAGSRTPPAYERLLSILARECPLDWSVSDRNPAIGAVDFPEVVGFDTSALKALRRDPLRLNSLLSGLATRRIPIVLPGQAVQEYWNNHRTFSNEDSNRLRKDIEKLQQGLLDVGAASASEHVATIEEALKGLDDDLQEVRDARAFLRRSTDAMDELLRFGRVVFAPRLTFGPLAELRLASKVAPGFDDAKMKAAALGDFFVWADFLLGCMLLRRPLTPRTGSFGLLVTDEKKIDWRTGELAHPVLSAEYKAACGLELGVTTVNEMQSAQYYKALVGQPDRRSSSANGAST